MHAPCPTPNTREKGDGLELDSTGCIIHFSSLDPESRLGLNYPPRQLIVRGASRMTAADDLTTTTPAPHASLAAATILRQKVFISYSRTDSAFADELVAGLEYDGSFEVFLDRHSIHEGEAWRERLGGLIAAADVVVFLLSKASAASELCRWEADHAKSLSKRIVPALIEPVTGITVAPTLSALNYVRFDEDRSFMVGLTALRGALRADLHWIREHTRLLTRAQEWEASGRPDNRLLTGADIGAAKLWLEQRPPDAPAPLELHHEYISASERAESVRLSGERKRAEELKGALRRSRQALVGVLLAGALAIAAMLAAGYFWLSTRAIGAEAEAAVRERDAFIKASDAKDIERAASITTLTAQLEAQKRSATSSGPAATPHSPAALAETPASPVATPAAPSEKARDSAEDASALLTISGLEQEIDRVSRLRPGGGVKAPPRPERDLAGTKEAYLATLQQHILLLRKQLDDLNSSLREAKRPAPYRSKL